MRTDARPGFAPCVARISRSEIRDLLRVVERPDVLSLAGGLPAPGALPVARIRAAADAALCRPGPNGPPALQYGPTEGLDELRELVAPGTLGSPALGPADHVLVTTGSQQALELVVRSLVGPGDPVVVEDPLYLGVRQVLDAAGATLVPVPVDADGLRVDRLADWLRTGLRPKLVTCVPNFSNPSGATLTPARRDQLADLAARYGFVVVEDNPYHGLGFATGRPDAPVAARAPEHTVVIGSASKMLAPGLRLGFVGAPGWLAPTLAQIKQSLDLHTSTLSQMIAIELLRDPAFLAMHLTGIRRENAARAAALGDAIAPAVSCPPPTGGMFLWGEAAVDTRAMLPAALTAGVAYVPGDAFTVARDGSHSLRLSFATLTPTELRTAAARLIAVLTPATAGAPR
ncbi:MAG: aminotransferase-like domain-containing protein [Acidimicrobiia bacterium]